jgi:hypothetical protein
MHAATLTPPDGAIGSGAKIFLARPLKELNEGWEVMYSGGVLSEWCERKGE